MRIMPAENDRQQPAVLKFGVKRALLHGRGAALWGSVYESGSPQGVRQGLEYHPARVGGVWPL